ncbi:hypothetical protein [Desulfonatronovibrio magnus]|uniref:hypothetical protein n=1 Tax=Desulfonatronovibrio magnus TaxID=698827 RepID=UPI0005EBDFFC|nr:hypothetical protein [Desulfonatronovibrio magnus]
MINSAEKIRTFLNASMDQRSRFIIVLPKETTSVGDLGGYLVDFDDNNLKFELVNKNFSPKWKGLTVTCYFRVVDMKGSRKEVFFNFESKILKFTSDISGQTSLLLSFPMNMTIGQRRKSMRIGMDIRLLLGFSIWEEDKFIKESSNSNQKCLYPPLITAKCINSGKVRVVNISAGGLRKEINAELIQELGINWKKNHPFIIWMVLLEPSTGKKQDLWLKARIKYKHEDPAEKDQSLGIEFVSYGTINSSKKMIWNRVKNFNIDQIGNWTYQRYLEEFRQECT